MLRILAVALFFFVSSRSLCQVRPANGSRLTYRIIGFSFPSDAGSDYTLEIASGNIAAEDQFSKAIVVTEKSKTNRIVAEVPSFGEDYTWRVVYTGKGKKHSPMYHFSTRKNQRVDTTVTRLRVDSHAQTPKDAYVVVEGSGVIYDMQGNPVWYIPDTSFPSGYIGDVKLTPQGNITFFANRIGYETNYDGDILWKMPDHDTICKKVPGSYHHEFARLPSGHHMVLGVEDLKCERVVSGNEITIKTSAPRQGYRRNIGNAGNPAMGTFGTVLEYDADGNLVWSWRSSDYLLKEDFAYYTPFDTMKKFTAQATAFFFDEKNSAIYVGFRDLSRIVKVAYPAGSVLAVYGEPFVKGVPQHGNGIFCNPHSISRTHDGDLLVYSNNTCYSNSFLPAIVAIHEPLAPTDELRKVWGYAMPPALSVTTMIPDGGNVTELPDGSFAVCISKPEYCRLLWLSKDKKVLWSATPEKYDADAKRFINPEQYRSSIIHRADIERMIWAVGAKH